MTPTDTIGEKVETIVSSYQRHGSQGGAFGALVNLGDQRYRVETEGFTFIVTRKSLGWSVFAGPFEVCLERLEQAAQEAFTLFKAQREKGPVVSRNFKIAGAQ